MPTAFSGTLNSNEIFASIYNMIISQDFYSSRLSGLESSLVSKFRTDGTLYGDSKLYYDADILETHAWGNYSEAANLLSTDKPADPKCQVITLDQFRQIRLTLDEYLSKRAWSDEGSFGKFISVMRSYIQKTKKLYDVLLVNTYVGTVVGGANRATETITLSGISATGEERNRLRAQTIATGLANLVDDMKDASRDFNDYQFMDAFNPGDLMVIYNNHYANEITKMDLPTVFHKEGLENVGEEKLNARYFGTVITSTNKSNYAASTPAAGKPIDSDDDTYVPGSNNANGCIRSLVEQDVTVGGVTTHVWPGDEIPAGATIKSGGNFELGDVYIVDSTIICKVIHKDAIKYMSAFEVATEFFNPRALLTNNYLTFGYSYPDYLKSYPVINVIEG